MCGIPFLPRRRELNSSRKNVTRFINGNGLNTESLVVLNSDAALYVHYSSFHNVVQTTFEECFPGRITMIHHHNEVT